MAARTVPRAEASPALRTTFGLLPRSPGVYLFRDGTGRVLYVGRATSLRDRVPSYWSGLRDRPRLRRMVAQIESAEPLLCDSVHEAALLERSLLRSSLPRWNRSRGEESLVWLRLSSSSSRPALTVEHEVIPTAGVEHFGPYAGGDATRLAVTGLLQLFPIQLCGTAAGGSERALAETRGVGPESLPSLLSDLAAVLRREPVAVGFALAGLESMRDALSAGQRFEVAATVQARLEAVRWLTDPQKLGDGFSGAVCGHGTAGGTGVLLTLQVRDGWLVGRTITGSSNPLPEPRTPWEVAATRQAGLYAALLDAGVAPYSSRPLRARQR